MEPIAAPFIAGTSSTLATGAVGWLWRRGPNNRLQKAADSMTIGANAIWSARNLLGDAEKDSLTDLLTEWVGVKFSLISQLLKLWKDWRSSSRISITCLGQSDSYPYGNCKDMPKTLRPLERRPRSDKHSVLGPRAQGLTRDRISDRIQSSHDKSSSCGSPRGSRSN
jgi:hypothetical protein